MSPELVGNQGDQKEVGIQEDQQGGTQGGQWVDIQEQQVAGIHNQANTKHNDHGNSILITL